MPLRGVETAGNQESRIRRPRRGGERHPDPLVPGHPRHRHRRGLHVQGSPDHGPAGLEALHPQGAGRRRRHLLPEAHTRPGGDRILRGGLRLELPEPGQERPVRRLPGPRQRGSGQADPGGPETGKGSRPGSRDARGTHHRRTPQPADAGGLAFFGQGDQLDRPENAHPRQCLPDAHPPDPAAEKPGDRRRKDGGRLQARRRVAAGHLPPVGDLLQPEHHHLGRLGLHHHQRELEERGEVPGRFGVGEHRHHPQK